MRIKDLHKRVKNRWYQAFRVDATLLTNSEFYFDRWRIYNNPGSVWVAAFDSDVSTSRNDDIGRYIKSEEIASKMIGKPQKFSSSGSFEHDFILDLSSRNTDEVKICISGLSYEPDMTQIYASPTGFSSTRNKNAQLKQCYLKLANPTDYLRLDNQPGLFVTNDLLTTSESVINALNVLVNNSGIVSANIDDIIIWTDKNGKSNGTLDYSGNENPTVDSRAAYDSLIAKNWTITGTPPPTS